IGMLNHPNILTIHDIGAHEDQPYIVSELLEGETLRERIKGGALVLRKAVDFALQIGRGLAAAHERGVVHRDLKPENLFITRDERIKILDFGLAKLAQPPSSLTNASVLNSPVIQTEPGKVMGSVGYMSPEQIRGEEADSRSDIFSFGVILYEMFAGERPFRGDTAVETMNAILKTDAPELPAPLNAQSPGVERVIHRCLEKRPEQRFQSVSDLGFALEALTGMSSRQAIGATGSATLPLQVFRERASQMNWLGRLGWVLAGLALLAAVPLAVAYFRRPPAGAQTVRLSVSPPEKAVRMGDPAISPDGRRLAFVAFADGKSLLWVRPLGSLAAQPMPGTEGAASPFWSPNGRAIGFFAQSKLKKIALSGEPPVALCDVSSTRGGGTWNRDDVILFVPHLNAGVHRVAASGGTPAPVTTPDAAREETSHLSPHFLPDGRRFLYLVTGQHQQEAGVYLASLDGREKRRLLTASSGAVFAPPGYLLFVRDGSLLAQPFDAGGERVTGEPVRLTDQMEGGGFGRAGFTVSNSGVLVHGSRSLSAGNQQLGWVDREGKSLGAIGSPGSYLGAMLSPDETRVAAPRPDRLTG
ncbi:MAG: protein kinase domain-containing protein, partial [Blastocatellia bacterium]